MAMHPIASGSPAWQMLPAGHRMTGEDTSQIGATVSDSSHAAAPAADAPAAETLPGPGGSSLAEGPSGVAAEGRGETDADGMELAGQS